ncbi:MAG: ABC transporter permease [Sarcina sp.]
MNILLYEFKKIFKKNFIWILTLFLIIANSLLFLSTEYKENKNFIQNIELYKEIQVFDKSKDDQSYSVLSDYENRLFEYSLFLSKDDIANLNISLNQDDIDYFDSIYNNSQEKIFEHLDVLNKYLEQLKYKNSYSQYVETVLSQADNMGSYSVFQENNSFSNKNMLKTKEDYSKIKNLDIGMDISDAIVKSTSFAITDLLIIIIISVMIFYLITEEKNQETISLANTMKHGKLKFCLSKISCIILVSIIITIVFYGINILLGEYLYGFGDLSRSIQSINEFVESTLLINILEYIVLFIVSKLLIIVTITLAITFLTIILKEVKIVYVSVFIFILIQYYLYKFIPENSYLSLFKFINIFSFADVFNILSKYKNINLFNFAINLKFLFFMICIVGILGLYISSVYCLKNNIQINLKYSRKILKRQYFPNNIFSYEIGKVLLGRKILILFVAMIVISINQVYSFERTYNLSKGQYTSYANILKGENLDEIINNEIEKFDLIDQNVSQAFTDFENGSITKDEYRNIIFSANVLRQKQELFYNDVLPQYEYIKNKSIESGIKLSFINKYFLDDISSKTSERIKVLYALIIVMLLSSTLILMDTENDFLNIVSTYKNGRKKYVISKILLAFIFSFITVVIIYMPDYILAFREYGSEYLKENILSAKAYSAFISMSIAKFLVIANSIRIFSLFVVSLIIMYLSIKLKKYFSVITIAIITLAFPLVLSEKISIFDKLSFNSFLLIETLMRDITSFTIVIIILIASLLLLVKKIFRYNLEV